MLAVCSISCARLDLNSRILAFNISYGNPQNRRRRQMQIGLWQKTPVWVVSIRTVGMAIWLPRLTWPYSRGNLAPIALPCARSCPSWMKALLDGSASSAIGLRLLCPAAEPLVARPPTNAILTNFFSLSCILPYISRRFEELHAHALTSSLRCRKMFIGGLNWETTDRKSTIEPPTFCTSRIL